MLSTPAPWLEFSIFSYLAVYCFPVTSVQSLQHQQVRARWAAKSECGFRSQADLTSDSLSIFKPEFNCLRRNEKFDPTQTNNTLPDPISIIVATMKAKWPKCMFTLIERDTFEVRKSACNCLEQALTSNVILSSSAFLQLFQWNVHWPNSFVVCVKIEQWSISGGQ